MSLQGTYSAKEERLRGRPTWWAMIVICACGKWPICSRKRHSWWERNMTGTSSRRDALLRQDRPNSPRKRQGQDARLHWTYILFTAAAAPGATTSLRHPPATNACAHLNQTNSLSNHCIASVQSPFLVLLRDLSLFPQQ